MTCEGYGVFQGAASKLRKGYNVVSYLREAESFAPSVS